MATRLAARITARPAYQTQNATLPSNIPFSARAPRGAIRACVPLRDELLRHRVISADGRDCAVATYFSPRAGCLLTSAYPVQHGYLVMVRQPLCELRSATEDAAREAHMHLVRVVAEAGIRALRERERRVERADAHHGVSVIDAALPSHTVTELPTPQPRTSPLAAPEDGVLVGSAHA